MCDLQWVGLKPEWSNTEKMKKKKYNVNTIFE